MNVHIILFCENDLLFKKKSPVLVGRHIRMLACITSKLKLRHHCIWTQSLSNDYAVPLAGEKQTEKQDSSI